VGGGASPRPIGVSPALKKVADANGNLEDWFRGSKWPPIDYSDNPWPNTNATEFPRRYWSSSLYSIVVLGEFVSAKGGTTNNPLTWDTITLPPYPKAAALKRELDELLELVEYRPGVMSEAMAQRSGLGAYWRGLLMFNADSHPWTCDLLEIASRVGQFQAMHYKNEFNRPRPSQLSPALMPPIAVPGHASYPSGHATEAYLMAKCLEKVMPIAASTPVDPNDPETTALQRMAQRIARNREVLGVHYPSDSAAGKKLAEDTFAILQKCKTVNNTTNPSKPGIIQRSQQEWDPRNRSALLEIPGLLDQRLRLARAFALIDDTDVCRHLMPLTESIVRLTERRR